MSTESGAVRARVERERIRCEVAQAITGPYFLAGVLDHITSEQARNLGYAAADAAMAALAATPRAESERGPGDEWMDDPRTQGDRLNIALGLLAGFPRFRDARVLIAGVRDELWRSEAAPDFQHDGDHASLERISRGEAAPLEREAVIEECARVAENCGPSPWANPEQAAGVKDAARWIATEIRALAASEAAAPQDTENEHEHP